MSRTYRAVQLSRSAEEALTLTSQCVGVRTRAAMKRDRERLKAHLSARVTEHARQEHLKNHEIAKRSGLSKEAFRKLLREGFLSCPVSTLRRVAAALGRKLHIDIV